MNVSKGVQLFVLLGEHDISWRGDIAMMRCECWPECSNGIGRRLLVMGQDKIVLSNIYIMD